MLNIFKRPVEKASIEAWSKMTDDVAKVALLTIPVILYSKEDLGFKLLNILALFLVIYFFIIIGRFCRRILEEQTL
ncbi:hypothetical protein A1D22_07105 [Pasteurellaceae bacterium LFhippo2]|nr:hypothetical protein [Pasteurellaceae bacterium LFhippo2]